MASPSTGSDDPHAGYRAGLTGYLLFALRIAALVLLLLITVPLHYLWRIFTHRSPWPQWFLGAVGWLCGARVRTVGRPEKRNVFFIANHLSWIDIPIIAGRTGSAFVAQDGIQGWPFIGWLCTLNDTVFVSRTDRMGVHAQIERVRDAIKWHRGLTIFPEGTTTDGYSLLPFKSPLLKVLDPPPPDIRVQPIFLEFGRAGPEIAWIGEETAARNAWRVLTRWRPFAVTIHFLEPFDPAGHAGRKAIAAHARAEIAARLIAGMAGKATL